MFFSFSATKAGTRQLTLPFNLATSFIVEELKKVDGVQQIDKVDGVYNLITKVGAENLEKLKEIIRTFTGQKETFPISMTSTMIIVKDDGNR